MATERPISTQERNLCEFLKSQPQRHGNRFSAAAERALLSSLYWSLAGGVQANLRILFPKLPGQNERWSLREAQGGQDGAEYTEAARGKTCGHIFKPGEATYRCRTCSVDDTCCMCSRCYDASDHTGHMIFISVCMGNNGCCDCGDPEAWKRPVHCAIHDADARRSHADKGKTNTLPEELLESMRMTIGRAYDYVCDVISCSPEQLRLAKTRDSVLRDERLSRLTSAYYDGDVQEAPTEWALLLWNDEKHTTKEVSDQICRACKIPAAEGDFMASETDDVGRTIVKYSTDLDGMLRTARTIEQIKVTVTIRSARDTFREQMCATIVDWLSDIAGCSLGSDHDILRRTVCEEMLKPWNHGGPPVAKSVGASGIDDYEQDEHVSYRQLLIQQQERAIAARVAAQEAGSDDGEDGAPEDDSGDDDYPESMDSDASDDAASDFLTVMGITRARAANEDPDNVRRTVEPLPNAAVRTAAVQTLAEPLITDDDDADTMMDVGNDDNALEVQEATLAGYPPPPPPPVDPPRTRQDRELSPSDSDTAEAQPLLSRMIYAKAGLEVPATPLTRSKDRRRSKGPARYWLEVSPAYHDKAGIPVYEDLCQRLRLDWLILFDLRMWKRLRVRLRDLYISTVVSLQEFKRILGLRFAGLYTTLAQLYLIADREPDHSIINLSLQMLTTPSITAEIVDRGNFLTNLMAILFTFLTTRQVGYPYQIYPNATLSFDTGSVTNRRMYHFFMDLRHLLASQHVQASIRSNERYVLQFMDLIKLHQGICPNVRAVGEHVEYETDLWISASLITREINRLCRFFSEAYKCDGVDSQLVLGAIRLAAQATILHSLGTERKRFVEAEIKDNMEFVEVGGYDFDNSVTKENPFHWVVKFNVASQPISFHHALHYFLSWLIECGRDMHVEQMLDLLCFTSEDLYDPPRAMGTRLLSEGFSSEDNLMAAFDYPLRVCAWLAQMKASMWVRNGMSLRHQQGTYRGVGQRDVSHHRDIFLLQTAMVTCDPSRVLVSMIDRFGVEAWMKAAYNLKNEKVEDTQVLDVVEDLIHLLVVILSDRTSLLPDYVEPSPHMLAMRRDIAHVLCFKPLSFSDICGKLPDRFQDQEECQEILEEMTTFKGPEGLSDVGTFELKPEHFADIDPYTAYYNRNQREEADILYRAYMAKKTGQKPADIIFEAKPPPIHSGVFATLPKFTTTGMFIHIIYYSLLYPIKAGVSTPSVPMSRIETFLQIVLHLMLLAIHEDDSNEDDTNDVNMLCPPLPSFVQQAFESQSKEVDETNAHGTRTIASLLEAMATDPNFKSCHVKISLVLSRMKQRRPRGFAAAFAHLDFPIDRLSTESPAQDVTVADRERKKRAALDRQAKVMAQFQQQQKNFLNNQTEIDWGNDDASVDGMDIVEEKKHWAFPSGTCILCQEETGKDGRVYGTFALMMKSTILRQTDFGDPDFVREAYDGPDSLDRSAESIRPFGLAQKNRQQVTKINYRGEEVVTERYSIGKGFPAENCLPAYVSTGCGHIMHYSCFEHYFEATVRRHGHQVARHHPERIHKKEFICPLCKALGNAFLPIIWSPLQEASPSILQPTTSFSAMLQRHVGEDAPGGLQNAALYTLSLEGAYDLLRNMYEEHNAQSLNESLASKLEGLIWKDLALRGRDDVSSLSRLDAVKELFAIYTRLNGTMALNNLATASPLPKEASDVTQGWLLASALATSISSAEIQQRGIEAGPGRTLLDSMPESILTHLKIFCGTAQSFVAINGVQNLSKAPPGESYLDGVAFRYYGLFGHPLFDAWRDKGEDFMPLLAWDSFTFCTECSLHLVDVAQIDIMHLVRICYLAEITKVIMGVARHMSQAACDQIINAEARPEDGLADCSSFAELCQVIAVNTSLSENGSRSPGLPEVVSRNVAGLRAFVRRYALTYLRKVVVLLHVQYALDLSMPFSVDPAATELDRLHAHLHLESFDELCAMAVASSVDSPLPRLIIHWVHQYQKRWSRNVMTVAHPVIYELIGLPKQYDTLMEEVMKRRCPTTGRDVVDPMLCLFCGEIFCGQSICCTKDGQPEGPHGATTKIGGAQQHMLKCQGTLGLYINIRKCCVFYLFFASGSWMVAPYIDRYGEVDPGLRHARQLFLNQRRYDALLRTVWLGHGVPSVISRKLEMDINNGGWETV